MTDFRNNPAITARGLRNNNPGNIVKTSIPWQGKVSGNDSRFETFSDIEYGLRAMALNLMTYWTGNVRTPAQIANKWSPDGNESSYAQAISSKTGVALNSPVPNTPDAWRKLLKAMTEVENGVQQARAVTDAMYRAAVDMAANSRKNFFKAAAISGGALAALALLYAAWRFSKKKGKR